ASQEHPIRQRGQLGRRALLRAPDHAAFAIRRKAVGVLARILCSRVPQGRYRDGDRIDEDGFSGTLGARVELVGDVDDIIGDQLADFVAVLLLIGVGQRFAHELTGSIVTERSSGRRTLWPIPIMTRSPSTGRALTGASCRRKAFPSTRAARST